MDPPEVDAKIMLITAIIGLICNLVNFFALEGECCVKRDVDDESEDSVVINPNELSSYFGKGKSPVLSFGQELKEGLNHDKEQVA